MSAIKTGDGAYIIKCAICNDEICGDSQFINDKWYHNKCIVKQLQEIERLKKENNDLRKLYQRTYKHLLEIGNDELARYFQAQIDECRTFYVEPIIDYYEETKRLNNIINELEKSWKEEITRLTNFIQEDSSMIEINNIRKMLIQEREKDLYKLQELKGSDKE